MSGTTGSGCCLAAAVLYSSVSDAAALQLGSGCMAAPRPLKKVVADHDLGFIAVHNRRLQNRAHCCQRWHLLTASQGLLLCTTAGCKIGFIAAHRLPEKVAADRDGLLVAFAHSDVGVLNQVVELWRFPSAAACIRYGCACHPTNRLVHRWLITHPIGGQPCHFLHWLVTQMQNGHSATTRFAGVMARRGMQQHA